MSGEPKTLTPEPITLEQALAEVHQHEWVIHFHNDGFVEIETFSGDGLTYEEGLLPALSDALGVRVVARDEAAELRAALDAARDAMVSALAYHHHSLSNPVKEELNAAINRAGRALAGGESQR